MAPALFDFSVTVCVTELSERLLLEGGAWRHLHATLTPLASLLLFLCSLSRRDPEEGIAVQCGYDEREILDTAVKMKGTETRILPKYNYFVHRGTIGDIEINRYMTPRRDLCACSVKFDCCLISFLEYSTIFNCPTLKSEKL